MAKQKNSKRKSLLTLPLTRSRNVHITKSFIKKAGVCILVLLAVISVGMISNVIPFAYHTVRCGQFPVESSKFAAAFSYKLPGDKGYGIHIFSEYEYCTKAEIEATHGYHRHPFTDAAKKENAMRRDQWKKMHEFDLSRVDYTVYEPAGYSIDHQSMSPIDGGIHTFYLVERDDGKPIRVRQMKKGGNYALCKNHDTSKRKCEVIGKDSQGRKVHREYGQRFKKGWVSYYVGTIIGNTEIILDTQDDKAALKILGAMRPYSD